ncbi:MAG: TonB-like [Tardiphaga sp.]|uniref:energy transducer TonB family protein n=1 Tax=Tardiphaga sp. TaxID=1926292 RepID=UPI00260BA68A|nr:energy transducer TonB [Tardiphaga sp.]MDB5501125.1 TonB-like [Tardiphaga sp.]
MNAVTNAFALHAPTDRAALRWTGSAVVIVAVHAGLIAAGIAWYRSHPPAGADIPAIMVDMAPASAAPQVQPQDAAPGPEMQQADAPSEPPPPEPMQQAVAEEPIAPTPLMEKPEVQAPPEQKIEPAPPPPEPAKLEPEPPKPVAKPVPPKPKPVHAEVKKKPSETPPAPRTTAAPRAERQAAAASAATAGAAAAAAALPSYRDRLAAHLQRYKEYPSEARTAGQQGVAMLSFTVSRSGQVLGSRLAGSSGVPALDAETMAMIRRAQPLPSFPPEMTQASLSFTVPVRFSIR